MKLSKALLLSSISAAIVGGSAIAAENNHSTAQNGDTHVGAIAMAEMACRCAGKCASQPCHQMRSETKASSPSMINKRLNLIKNI